MASKALVIAAYRQKLTELARLGVEVVAVVPPEWKEAGGSLRLEPGNGDGYRLVVQPVRFNGHFHLYHYPHLDALIKEQKPDLVHLDEEPYNLATYFGVRSARQAGIPSLFFSWQNLLRRYPPPFAQMEHQVYATVAHALAGSAAVGQVLRGKGYGGPLSVVPQFGVDPEVFHPGTAPKEGFRIGFLNRLIPAKAPLLTLDAFERLPSDATLEVLGDGPLRSELQLEIQRRGLAKRVTFEPRLPSAQVPEVLRRLDVVVLPSITTPRWKEQFGRILIEAMASGVPVVGSDSGEIPAVVGDAGLIVPEGDPTALAQALQRLYDDSNLRQSMATRGRQRVLDHFSHAHVAKLTYEAYRRVLNPEP